jgi:hypothetical protein
MQMSELLELIAPAAVALCVVRFILVVKVPGGNDMPDPAKIGLPSGSLASPAAAHAAVMRGQPTRRPWWKFSM